MKRKVFFYALIGLVALIGCTKTNDGPRTTGPGYSELANGHDYVDMGMPSGTMWATMNVGASNDKGYGKYFSWGETSNKDTYYFADYKYWDNELQTYTQYNVDTQKGINDNRKEMDLSDDAAHVIWGGSWRIPSEEQFRELIANSTIEWIDSTGFSGVRITSSKNGAKLYLPAAGYKNEDYTNGKGGVGDYWTRNLQVAYEYPWIFEFTSDEQRMTGFFRPEGLNIRAVFSTEEK